MNANELVDTLSWGQAAAPSAEAEPEETPLEDISVAREAVRRVRGAETPPSGPKRPSPTADVLLDSMFAQGAFQPRTAASAGPSDANTLIDTIDFKQPQQVAQEPGLLARVGGMVKGLVAPLETALEEVRPTVAEPPALREGPPEIRAATPTQPGLLERGLAAVGVLNPEEAQARRQARERALGAVQYAAKQAGVPVSEFVQPGPTIPGQALRGAAAELTLGLGPALMRAYGLETEEELQPRTTPEALARGAGQLAGFIAIPAKLGAAAVERTIGGWLAPAMTDSVRTSLAKQVASQVATLGTATSLAATGEVVSQPDAVQAAQKAGEAAKSGALLGLVFGGAGGIIPGDTLLATSARLGTGMATIDLVMGQRPWDDRDLAQKSFDYGVNAFFLFRGQDPRRVVDAMQTEANLRGSSMDQVFKGVVTESGGDPEKARQIMDRIVAQLPKPGPLAPEAEVPQVPERPVPPSAFEPVPLRRFGTFEEYAALRGRRGIQPNEPGYFPLREAYDALTEPARQRLLAEPTPTAEPLPTPELAPTARINAAEWPDYLQEIFQRRPQRVEPTEIARRTTEPERPVERLAAQLRDVQERLTRWRDQRAQVLQRLSSPEETLESTDALRATFAQIDEQIADLTRQERSIGGVLNRERVRAREAVPPATEVPPDIARRATEPAPVFFSQLQRTLEAKMPEAALPAQVRSIAAGGARAEEIKWTGLDDWLAQQGGRKVTKQEVLDFLGKNEVRVEEVTKGEPSPEQAREMEAAKGRLEEAERKVEETRQRLQRALVQKGMDPIEATGLVDDYGGDLKSAELFGRINRTLRQGEPQKIGQPMFRGAGESLESVFPRAAENGVRIAGTAQVAIDTSESLPKESIDQIIGAPYMRPMVDRIQTEFAALQRQFAGANPVYRDVRFLGIDLGSPPTLLAYNVQRAGLPSAIAVNIHSTMVDVVLNKYPLDRSVVANRQFLADRIAVELHESLVHELTHQQNRSHDAAFKNLLVQHLNATQGRTQQFSSDIMTILEEGQYANFTRLSDDALFLARPTGAATVAPVAESYWARPGYEVRQRPVPGSPPPLPSMVGPPAGEAARIRSEIALPDRGGGVSTERVPVAPTPIPAGGPRRLAAEGRMVGAPGRLEPEPGRPAETIGRGLEVARRTTEPPGPAPGEPERPAAAPGEPARVEPGRTFFKALQDELRAYRPEQPLSGAIKYSLETIGSDRARTERTYAAWSERMVQELGADIRAHLPEIWRDVQRPGPGFRQLPKELQEPRLLREAHRTIASVAEELFTVGGIRRDPNKRITDQVADLISQERLPLGQMAAILERHGMGFAEFGREVFRADVADAARLLGRWGVISQQLKAAYRKATPEDRTLLGSLVEGLHEEARTNPQADLGWIKRLDSIRRAMLVTQLATSARNFISSVGRIGVDTLDQTLQRGIEIATGRRQQANPMGPLYALMRLGTKNKDIVNSLLELYPDAKDRAFWGYSSDIAAKMHAEGVEPKSLMDRGMRRIEDLIPWANWHGALQEFVTRRAVIAGELDAALRRKGSSLKQAIDEVARLRPEAEREIREAAVAGGTALSETELARSVNGRIADRIGKLLSQKDVEGAVEKALEMTFAQRPEFGSVAWHGVQIVNKLPVVLTGPIPFPRFMWQALKFYTEFSPLGFARLLKEDRRTPETLSRAIIGTAMIGAAYLLRESEWAGEKWYEVKVGGRTIDIRPFNPFAVYFLLAEFAKQWRQESQEGIPARLDAYDMIQGFASVNLKAGLGLFALDKLIRGLRDMEDWKRFGAENLPQIPVQYLASFLTGLQTVNDVIGQFDEQHAIVRNRDANPYLDPFLEKIPGLRTTLDPLYSPTQEDPIQRSMPLLRQVSGVTVVQPKNAAQEELDRLHFTRSEITGRQTGDKVADQLIAKHLGMLVERYLAPFVETAPYQALDNELRALMLTRQLAKFRQAAFAAAKMDDPERFRAIKLEQMPIRKRLLLKSLTGED